MYTIAEFYGFSSMEGSFLSQVSLAYYEKENMIIMNQVWFAYMLVMEPRDVRYIIARFKKARFLITHRLSGSSMITVLQFLVARL